ncbi:Aldo/keto reductase [Obba rivulosa]|uniref:Aldo/keto reductase n=1 Tax=Obba rivulosa TaxID=1052685 RepID=A0A8E2AI43_9APHY|nr:Aldo/keto reductase [Obba rivulosa]
MPEEVKIEFDPKNMPFRRLGSSGLRVPVFSLGGWLTLGATVFGDPVKDIIKTAFENGINMFDTAEAYAQGQSEVEMGRVIKELGFRRSDLIITTKLFWGVRPGPNASGLSRKHIIEGTKESLQRMQLDYVDVIFAHRPDATVPMEETVRAFNFVINQGWAFYWATSEWSAQEIEEAHHVATKLGLSGPIAEQCEHNLFHRERPESEYALLYRKHGLGTTVFSALAQGLLTGKVDGHFKFSDENGSLTTGVMYPQYNDGIPAGSRLDVKYQAWLQRVADGLTSEEGQAKINKIKALSTFAEEELGCKVSHLALAWVAQNPNTSTVILGASKPEQVVDNLKALEIIPKLTPEVLKKIDDIVGTKPPGVPNYGRPELDSYGRPY